MTYFWRVRRDKYGIIANVGIYDENRWPDQPEGERGGVRFGLDADLFVVVGWGGHFSIEVNQGSMSTNLEDGRLKADVYEQVLNVAEVLEFAVTPGMTMEKLSELAWFIPEGLVTYRFERAYRFDRAAR